MWGLDGQTVADFWARTRRRFLVSALAGLIEGA
jgi:hypothetical protein